MSFLFEIKPNLKTRCFAARSLYIQYSMLFKKLRFMLHMFIQYIQSITVICLYITCTFCVICTLTIRIMYARYYRRADIYTDVTSYRQTGDDVTGRESLLNPSFLLAGSARPGGGGGEA